MNNTDFYGLWSTGGHNELIDRALPNLSEAARRGVKEGSKYADSFVAGHQYGPMAFMHAMSSPQLSKRESREKMREFVNKQLELFQRKSKAAKKEPRVGDFSSGNIMSWVHDNLIDSRGNGVVGNGVACMDTDVMVQNNLIRGYQVSVRMFCTNADGNLTPP
jgi:hypothetical protein